MMSAGISCSYVPMFGETDYDPGRYISHISFDEQLDALGRAVDAGKVSKDDLKVQLAFNLLLQGDIFLLQNVDCYCRSDTSD